MLSEPRPMG